MFLADTWTDYEVIDTGDGEKLERWGNILLRRPDPQVIWPKTREGEWARAQARYIRSDRGGGAWEYRESIPERWTVTHRGLKFFVRPTGFKHTGLFPEQAANWLWMSEKLASRKNETPRVLNLFGYTGAATAACIASGAFVTHVDAAKGMVQWARENRDLNALPEDKSRWIVEDANSFIRRELRRGSRYDGILMDPPSYGRGASGEVWKLERELYTLVDTAARLLSERPLFLLINSYTTGFQASVLGNILDMTVIRRFGGRVRTDELCLPVTSGGVLPCGASGRWEHA